MSPRMAADERREQILGAAARAFARGGFHGTTTDAVAREAGVSQPYVVRLFGTKLQLFLEVFARAAEQIRVTFAEVLESGPFDPERQEDWDRLGLAYADLLQDRDVLQVMMHGFSAGSVSEVAAMGRGCMDQIYATIASTGCSPEQARDFIAHGMLLNVMLALQAPEHLDEGGALGALTTCVFGDALVGAQARTVPE